MDAQLARAVRAYVSDPTDENAHALARISVRFVGGAEAATPTVSTDPVRLNGRALANCCEIWVEYPDGTTARYLDSYGTRVAARFTGGRVVWSSEAAYSRTSRKHVRAWLDMLGSGFEEAEDVSAKELARL